MREQKYYLVFDEVERGIILRSLNELRNRLLLEGRYTDAADEAVAGYHRTVKSGKCFRVDRANE